MTAYLPRHVTQAVAAVEDHAGRWLLISTGSVYDRSRAHLGMDESAPRLAPRRDTEDTDSAYGEFKVAVEDDVLAHFGDRATIVRPGLIAGPHDPTDRFTRWVRRAARGGPLAVPARPGQPMRVVDVRDVARLVLSLLEDDRPGAFNAMGEPTTLDELVRACARGAGTSVELVHVDPAAVPLGFPLVLHDPSWDVLCRSSPAAARAAGLTVTAYERTAADVLAWDRARGQPPLAQDLTAEREDELLRRHRPRLSKRPET